ncbi:hypothetical protein HOG75_00450 [bacterium]|nr:hypothetical protein [bacterium]MBT5988166.1 hypothetical protein [bacterium]
MQKILKFNAFGRIMLVERVQERWIVFWAGNEGKKRLAEDIILPSDLHEDEIAKFLTDILHEEATPERDEVIRI